MPTREAQPHCTPRPGRHDVEADAPSVVSLRQRATAWYCSKTVDLEAAFVKAENIFYVSYINYVYPRFLWRSVSRQRKGGEARRYENNPAPRIFSRSLSALTNAFSTGRVIASLRTSRRFGRLPS